MKNNIETLQFDCGVSFLIIASIAFDTISSYFNETPKIMKQIFMAVVCMILATNTFGETILYVNSFPENNSTGLKVGQEIPSTQKKLTFKKLSFKERLLWKWLEKKLAKKSNSKKSVNESGFVSLIFSIIALSSIVILIITDSEALLGLLLVAFLAGLVALILGIISLTKRSKLKDQTGTKAWPAIVGITISIVIGILLTLLLV